MLITTMLALRVATCDLWGRVELVDDRAEADITARVVEHVGADLRVQLVEHPSGPGQWAIVDRFPRWRVYLVDDGEIAQITIRIVEAFPGC